MLRNIRRESWPADTLYIWTNDKALPQLRQRIGAHIHSLAGHFLNRKQAGSLILGMSLSYVSVYKLFGTSN